MDPDEDQCVASHGYGLGTQRFFVRLVLAGISLRGASRTMAIFAETLGWLEVPHWTTGRLWLLRLGHAALSAAKQQAADWVWLIDHSVQIGQEKCLVIVGVRGHRPQASADERAQEGDHQRPGLGAIDELLEHVAARKPAQVRMGRDRGRVRDDGDPARTHVNDLLNLIEPNELITA